MTCKLLSLNYEKQTDVKRASSPKIITTVYGNNVEIKLEVAMTTKKRH